MRAEKLAALEQESALEGIYIDPRDRSTEWMSEHHTKFGNLAYVLAKIFKGRAPAVYLDKLLTIRNIVQALSHKPN